jgi:predicted AlkP superfamily phosphohydrolase/phosphomutase
MDNNGKGKSRLFVVGLDGATFDIIQPLIKKGRLKNIASLMENGAWGTLHSTIPAFSPIAWTSLITGVNPGKHGITDAFIHHIDEYRISFINSTYRKYKPIWSVLNEFGKKANIINVPLTYPPEKLDGVIITGMFTPENADDFIYPTELRKNIKRMIGKYVFEGVQSDNLEKVLQTTYDTIEQHDKIASYLLDEYESDLFFLVYVETDRIQHQFWKFTDNENPTVSRNDKKKYENVISDIYQRLDISIGKLLNRVREEDTLMIVSDHGFGPLHRAFSLSNWLIENGYTVYKEANDTSNKSKSKFLGSLHRRLFGKFADKDKELNRYFGNIDWQKTKAFTEGAAGGVFINMKKRQKEGIVKDGEDYESLRLEIIDKLKELRDPLTGSRVVGEIYRIENIYKGGDLVGAPDLVVECSPRYHTISPSECVYYNLDDRKMFFNHKWSGKHHEKGIFILKGPAIKQGQKLDNLNIVDVAPTMLYLMNIPVSDDFDGKVMFEAINSDYFSDYPVQYTNYQLKTASGLGREFSENESKLLEERLRTLGYIE